MVAPPPFAACVPREIATGRWRSQDSCPAVRGQSSGARQAPCGGAVACRLHLQAAGGTARMTVPGPRTMSPELEERLDTTMRSKLSWMMVTVAAALAWGAGCDSNQSGNVRAKKVGDLSHALVDRGWGTGDLMDA